MGKSYNNFINLSEFFTGSHPLLQQPYTPMTIRFFILQAHYRSTVDFGNEALQAAEKGLQRLMDAWNTLGTIAAGDATTVDVAALRGKCYDAMNDDMNTAQVISHLFDASRAINQIADKKATITAADLDELKETFRLFAFDILGLKEERGSDSGREEAFGKVVDMLLEQRQAAKAAKDWATSDKIRNELQAFGFEIKDGKEGTTWKLNR
jgi:cysteinyl-tRNA synthetase